jgi:predicted RNA-binding protein with RPS1 domain
MKDNQFDLSKINEDYMKSIELQLAISKKIVVSLSEMSNKQLDLSIDYNKKVMDEINTQLNALLKQNQKMWTDFNNIQEEQQSNVEDKKTKESAKSETKKKWDVPVVE